MAAVAGNQVGVRQLQLAVPPVPDKPNSQSGDYIFMIPYWRMTNTILLGAEAMRKAGEAYLPKFPNEDPEDYEYRRRTAPFTNIYRDVLENLATKPFTKEVQIRENSASDRIIGKVVTKDGDRIRKGGFVEDVDGQGNHLHVFAMHLFFQGINDAINWILVDKMALPQQVSLAEEERLGARPYWIHLPASRVFAVYSVIFNGKEEFVHVRIDEPELVRTGYGETVVERVRIYNREVITQGNRVTGLGDATWELWEKERPGLPNLPTHEKWNLIDSGEIGIKIIPIVPFITGRRLESSWRFVPAMQDAAYLQVEHFNQETNLKAIKEQSCFPMLAGNGVSAPTDANGAVKRVPVGPKVVLFAPMSSDGKAGEWKYIEPNAETLKFLAQDLDKIENRMRELGRQPLTAQSGNLTVVTTAFAAQKGNSAIQAWTFNLKDSLEKAFEYTCLWLGDSSQPEVMVHRDFGIEMQTNEGPKFLLELRKLGEISRKAIVAEAKRRDFLSPEYDAEADKAEIEKEAAGLEPELGPEPEDEELEEGALL